MEHLLWIGSDNQLYDHLGRELAESGLSDTGGGRARADVRTRHLHVTGSRLPSFSNRTGHLTEDGLCRQHLGELLDQRP